MEHQSWWNINCNGTSSKKAHKKNLYGNKATQLTQKCAQNIRCRSFSQPEMGNVTDNIRNNTA